jgi:GNAT superfamily N-acetyltransferase
MIVRPVTDADWPQLLPLLRGIFAAGDTYAFVPDMDDDAIRAVWTGAHVVVATDGERVHGTAKMGANREGPGAHIGTASFAVDPDSGGRGVGRQLCEYTLEWLRSNGFRGVQFNAVVATNTNAIALYEALGFRIIGTVPEGFRHPVKGYVGLHVMYKRLVS